MNLSRLRYHIKRFLRDTPLGDSIVAAVMKRGLRTGKSQGLSTPAELGRYLDQAIADLTADGGKQLTYFEAGVFAGDSLVVWSQRCDAAGVETSIYGADSFAGLPDSVAGDEGSWFPGSFYCPKAVTEWNLERKGLSKDRVRLIEGWFDQSLTPALAEEIRTVDVALLDADAYSSTVPVLEFLGPLLADRVWLIFDDWYSGGNLVDSTGKTRGIGVERAFDEWCSGAGSGWDVEPVGDYEYHGDESRLAGRVFRLTATEG